MTELHSVEELERILDASDKAPLFLFKHSTRCPISAAAYRRVNAYEEGAADSRPPIYLVKVIEARPLSNLIAQRLGVEHQSPQIILVCHKTAVWNASHGAITAEAMNAAVDAV